MFSFLRDCKWHLWIIFSYFFRGCEWHLSIMFSSFFEPLQGGGYVTFTHVFMRACVDVLCVYVRACVCACVLEIVCFHEDFGIFISWCYIFFNFKQPLKCIKNSDWYNHMRSCFINSWKIAQKQVWMQLLILYSLLMLTQLSLHSTDAAGITDHTKHVLMDPGSNATFECTVDANPVTDGMITWSRDGYDMSRTVTSFNAGRSTLTVHDLMKDDSGVFTCNANNGIGEVAKAETALVVKCEYLGSPHNPFQDQSALFLWRSPPGVPHTLWCSHPIRSSWALSVRFRTPLIDVPPTLCDVPPPLCEILLLSVMFHPSM